MPPGPALRTGDVALCALVTGVVPHVGGPVVGTGTTVLIGGAPAAVAMDVIPCVGPPNMIAVGSATVLILNRPAARVGDLSAHGAPIAPGPGCPTVLIGG